MFLESIFAASAVSEASMFQHPLAKPKKTGKSLRLCEWLSTSDNKNLPASLLSDQDISAALHSSSATWSSALSASLVPPGGDTSHHCHLSQTWRSLPADSEVQLLHLRTMLLPSHIKYTMGSWLFSLYYTSIWTQRNMLCKISFFFICPKSPISFKFCSATKRYLICKWTNVYWFESLYKETYLYIMVDLIHWKVNNAFNVRINFVLCN